jgi:hypothetical protein
VNLPDITILVVPKHRIDGLASFLKTSSHVVVKLVGVGAEGAVGLGYLYLAAFGIVAEHGIPSYVIFLEEETRIVVDPSSEGRALDGAYDS